MKKNFKGTTRSGFEFKVSADSLDDMELLELLAESDDNDIMIMGKIMTKLLGKKQKARMYEHLRNERGIVPVTAVVAEIGEIFDQIKDLKK